MNKTATFPNPLHQTFLYIQLLTHIYTYTHKHKSIIQNAFQPEFLLQMPLLKHEQIDSNTN